MNFSTLILLKPDVPRRKLIGKIIERIENLGLSIIAMNMLEPKGSLIEDHYESLKDKKFFSELCEYIGSGPVIAIVVKGEDAIKIMRKAAGSTDPLEASPGTIRGDFATGISRNIIHTSDSAESAEREIQIWFPGKFSF